MLFSCEEKLFKAIKMVYALPFFSKMKNVCRDEWNFHIIYFVFTLFCNVPFMKLIIKKWNAL